MKYCIQKYQLFGSLKQYLTKLNIQNQYWWKLYRRVDNFINNFAVLAGLFMKIETFEEE
jgi:hypothetical protein